MQFLYAFANTFPEEQQRMYYDRCVASAHVAGGWEEIADYVANWLDQLPA